MKNPKVTLTKEINGNQVGKNLYALIHVDTDDCEDSRVELWRADDEAELYDLVRDEYLDYVHGNHGPIDEALSEAFDEEYWGYSLIHTKIGSFEPVGSESQAGY